MATREAACHCGQLRLEVEGEPFAVSICNCLACQRRTGSAFGMQGGSRRTRCRSRAASTTTRASPTRRTASHTPSISAPSAARRSSTRSRTTRTWSSSLSARLRILLPPPTESGYDSRRHPWIGLPDSIERRRPEIWEPVARLYEAGEYAEAVERGGKCSRPIPTTLASSTTSPAARAWRGDGGCDRAPAPGHRALRAAALTRYRGLGLRPDPRRAGVQGTRPERMIGTSSHRLGLVV